MKTKDKGDWYWIEYLDGSTSTFWAIDSAAAYRWFHNAGDRAYDYGIGKREHKKPRTERGSWFKRY